MSKKGLPGISSKMPLGREQVPHSRADNVFGRNGVDRVKAQGAKDVPRAHLPAIFVLRRAVSMGRTAKSIQKFAHPAQTAVRVVVVLPRNQAYSLLRFVRIFRSRERV